MNGKTEFLIKSLEKMSRNLAKKQRRPLEEVKKFVGAKGELLLDLQQMRRHLINISDKTETSKLILAISHLEEIESDIYRIYTPFAASIANASISITELRKLNAQKSHEITNVDQHLNAIKLVHVLHSDLDYADELNIRNEHNRIMHKMEKAKVKIYAL
ncbi:MAG TPA: hypothetical protein DCL21_04595 [Alphaproteobacteria bacterium]|nr:hypothetical protein [Alphaproteobacteria bacterium]